MTLGKYWHCIIGPTDNDLLPTGSDAPMRHAVEEAFIKVTGHEDDICYSGWGTTDEEKDFLLSYGTFKHMQESFRRRLKFAFTGKY